MAKTILAVDDSASIRQMVSFTLKGAGYTVVEAERQPFWIIGVPLESEEEQ